jgi:8-oxo-dGTP pyrophosphatase MutT (NUDIX family)
MARVPTTVERSAGGVLWRPGGGGDAEVEVCLISTKGGTRWQLPKGHASGEESEEEAARREVREETGCDGVVEGDLGDIVFWFFAGSGAGRKRIKKSVHFFLLRYTGGDTKDHDAEVDDAAWFPAGVAVRKLTFDSERKVLEQALARLARPS